MKKYSTRVLEATHNVDDNTVLDIQIECRPAQAEELKRLLFAMDAAGSMGCSRTFMCYVDGDGGFRPKVTINGQTTKNLGSEEESIKPVDFEQDTIEFAFD